MTGAPIHAGKGDGERGRSSRIELILEQITSLPTLPNVATRLLRLSSAADADFRQIVALIESDPALTARILGLCRRADRTTTEDVSTVERAVVLLGFDAVRAAALSVNIYELLGERPGKELDDKAGGAEARSLDRRAFWRHSIAVACAAEALAHEHRSNPHVARPPEAFTCGLLHGIGILALDYALPKTYARVLDIAGRGQRDLAEVERSVIGLDHHTSGRRLAEHWGLPKTLHDVIWLHGLPLDTLPETPSKRQIGLINTAIAIARTLHLGWAGDPSAPGDPSALAKMCGLNPETIAGVAARLHDSVHQRANLLGLDEPASESLLLGSIAQANRELERMRASLADREADTERHAWALGAISTFLQNCPARKGVPEVGAEVAKSGAGVLSATSLAIVLVRRGSPNFEIRRFTPEGRLIDARTIEPPADVATPAACLAPRDLNARLDAVAPWLAEQPEFRLAPEKVRVLTLWQGEFVAALLHDRDLDSARLPRAALRPVIQTWGAALAAAVEHETLKQSGEQLSALSQRLMEAQARLAEADALKRVADLVTAVSEEMQKPIAAITARCDLLVDQLERQRDQRSLEAVRSAAERMGSMVGALRLFTNPPKPAPMPVNVGWMLGRAVRAARQRVKPDPRRYPQPKVRLLVEGELPKIWVDGEQVIDALTEVVANALEAKTSETIEVRAHAAAADGRLVVLVMDDGPGMSEAGLQSAFEPFAASKEGGKRHGLGLAKCRRLLALNGAEIILKSRDGRGVIAAISLPLAGSEGNIGSADSSADAA